MKKIYYLFGVLLFGAMGSQSFGQCAINATATPGVVLNGVTISNSGISVAYNPNADLYYAVEGGSSAMHIVTFNSSGTEVASGANSGYDFRGVWWNPNLNQLECNGYNSAMLRVNDLDGSQYALNTGTNILAGAQPNSQSQGDYDWDNDEIIYYNGGSIHRYNRSTNTFIASYPITGLPVGTGNLSSETVGYTGCSGMEIVVFDIVLKVVYIIDKSTGAYVGSSALPAGAPASGSWYDHSFANGQMFVRNGLTWYGYHVFPPCTALTTSVSATELCEGGDVTLSATGTGNITWDNGVQNGVPFTPAVGTTQYTATSDASEECSFVVNITVVPYPTLDAGADYMSCGSDDQYLLDATTDADSLFWDNGIVDSVQFTIPYGMNEYVATATNYPVGCSVTDTVVVSYGNPSISIFPSDEMYGNDGSIALVIGSGMAPFTYDWDNDGVGDNDDNTDLFNVPAGTYTVIMTDASGCSVTQTATVGSQVGLEEGDVYFNMYPNPAMNMLNLESSATILNSRIIDSKGAEVYKGTDLQIDISELNPGTYLINVNTHQGVVTSRFTKM